MRRRSATGTFQFGAATIIPNDVALIILDCFETLVELHGRSYVARQGMPEFLDHFAKRRQVPIVVLSDGEQHAVEAAVAQAGVADRITSIIGAPDSLGELPDGRVLKRLDLPIRRSGAAIADTVFIGDSPLDAQAAQHHGVPFIRVPRSEDDQFSFAGLITGPSRYHSTVFAEVFLERYLQKP